MARAARQSGADPDDEDYEEFEEMLEQAEGAQVRVAHTSSQSKTKGIVNEFPSNTSLFLLWPHLYKVSDH